VSPDLARSLLDLIISQLEHLEARAGRRAVRVSVSVSPQIDLERVRSLLTEALSHGRTEPPDLELLVADGRPRLLTVDFEMKESD